MSNLEDFVNKCHDNLNNNSESGVALDYLNKRNIKTESISLHKIGYCLANEKVPKEISFFGKEDGDTDSKGSGFSYFIRGRIIVPIYSEFGEVVGIATRKPSFEPGNTWWNLSKPFHKSEHLFLLDKSRQHIFKKNKIFLVEGYIDAIILHQEGIKEVVGLMGTNLSARQIGLIARYCNNVCMCLDVDKNQSGQKATDKSVYALKRFDLCDSISVIEDLPVGEDPDVFVTKNGIEALIKKERKMSDSEISKIYRSVAHQNKKGK